MKKILKNYLKIKLPAPALNIESPTKSTRRNIFSHSLTCTLLKIFVLKSFGVKNGKNANFACAKKFLLRSFCPSVRLKPKKKKKISRKKSKLY